MRQERFERERAERGQAFERQLAELDAGRRAQDFPRAYRLLCQDLVLARDRGFEVSLIERLNALALRGHQHLYGARSGGTGFLALFLGRFPRAVRREWRLVALICVLFYGGGFVAFALCRSNPDFIYSIMNPANVAEFEQMYDPAAEHYGSPRAARDGVLMFFYYVGNNVSVAFRTFAGGVLFGIGSLLIIFMNALLIGGLAGHVANVGYHETFFPFVIGHGSFELTAIALAGVAGMRMGLALITAGPRSRAAMLKEATLRCVPILYGMTVMLVIAAVIESQWSPARAVSPTTKYWVGAGLWLFVIGWLGLGGRRIAPR